ncbi:hypothetical protein TSOC_013945, partial [Tetrabaena socialis]
MVDVDMDDGIPRGQMRPAAGPAQDPAQELPASRSSLPERHWWGRMSPMSVAWTGSDCSGTLAPTHSDATRDSRTDSLSGLLWSRSTAADESSRLSSRLSSSRPTARRRAGPAGAGATAASAAASIPSMAARRAAGERASQPGPLRLPCGSHAAPVQRAGTASEAGARPAAPRGGSPSSQEPTAEMWWSIPDSMLVCGLATLGAQGGASHPHQQQQQASHLGVSEKPTPQQHQHQHQQQQLQDLEQAQQRQQGRQQRKQQTRKHQVEPQAEVDDSAVLVRLPAAAASQVTACVAASSSSDGNGSCSTAAAGSWAGATPFMQPHAGPAPTAQRGCAALQAAERFAAAAAGQAAAAASSGPLARADLLRGLRLGPTASAPALAGLADGSWSETLAGASCDSITAALSNMAGAEGHEHAAASSHHTDLVQGRASPPQRTRPLPGPPTSAGPGAACSSSPLPAARPPKSQRSYSAAGAMAPTAAAAAAAAALGERWGAGYSVRGGLSKALAGRLRRSATDMLNRRAAPPALLPAAASSPLRPDSFSTSGPPASVRSGSAGLLRTPSLQPPGSPAAARREAALFSAPPSPFARRSHSSASLAAPAPSSGSNSPRGRPLTSEEQALRMISCTLRAADLRRSPGAPPPRVCSPEELQRRLLAESGAAATKVLLARAAGGAAELPPPTPKGRRGAFPPIQEDEAGPDGSPLRGAGRGSRPPQCG